MKKRNANNGKPNKPVEAANKVVAKGSPMPQSQAEFYAHAFTAVFNKLSKDDQEYLTRNLARPEVLIRGAVRPFENVNRFVKDVAEMGEALYDKAHRKVSQSKTPVVEAA